MFKNMYHKQQKFRNTKYLSFTRFYQSVGKTFEFFSTLIPTYVYVSVCRSCI